MMMKLTFETGTRRPASGLRLEAGLRFLPDAAVAQARSSEPVGDEPAAGFYGVGRVMRRVEDAFAVATLALLLALGGLTIGYAFDTPPAVVARVS